MFIKVCGINNLENFNFLENQEQISHIGFIFYQKSPRYCQISLPLLPKTKKRVGVFVNSTFAEIIEISKKFSLDSIQLHGNESPELCQQLNLNHEVIKVFQIDENFDFKFTEVFEKKVNYFLFDTKTENYGGSGKQFPWQLLEKYSGKTPFILSGGINPTSAEEIKKISHSKFAGIDLNSGFEILPGEKNQALISTFLNEL